MNEWPIIVRKQYAVTSFVFVKDPLANVGKTAW